jgi:hypothetical protein
MARDYNIYIHTDSPTTSKTKPNGKTASQASDHETSATATASQVARIVKNPVGALVGTLSKAAPAVGVAVIVAGMLDSALNVGLTLGAGYTGNQMLKMNYSNFKNSVGAFMNPLGTIKQVAYANMEQFRFSQKVEQEKILTGNSIINNYSGKAS